MSVTISRVNSDEAVNLLPDLTEILRDAVDRGASIGFMPPLSIPEAETYWREIIDLVCTPYRILVIAREDGRIVGTVQLNLEARANGRHRAEVMKLIVHSSHRQRGIAHALMNTIEIEAREANRTTLVLDTREGDDAERLYLNMGWVAAGKIPGYAANADGTLDTTVIMYKLLESQNQMTERSSDRREMIESSTSNPLHIARKAGKAHSKKVAG